MSRFLSAPEDVNILPVFRAALPITALCALVSMAVISWIKKHDQNEEIQAVATASAPSEAGSKWEVVPSPGIIWSVYRLRVSGGWLYASAKSNGMALCFVPESTITTAKKD